MSSIGRLIGSSVVAMGDAVMDTLEVQGCIFLCDLIGAFKDNNLDEPFCNLVVRSLDHRNLAVVVDGLLLALET